MKKRNRSEVFKPKVLATLSEEDRLDYRRRFALHEQDKLRALSSAKFLDELGPAFIVKYELPPRYDLNMDTGVITEFTPAPPAPRVLLEGA